MVSEEIKKKESNPVLTGLGIVGLIFFLIVIAIAIGVLIFILFG